MIDRIRASSSNEGAAGPWQRARLALVAVALLAVLAACGQSSSITITLDSAGAQLILGSQVEVEITLTRVGGATGDVTLSVTGLPADVTAAFAPSTLSGAALTSTLTLSATAAAPVGDYDLTITGTGTGLTAAADLALEVTGLTVNGRVTTIYDLPLVGVAIRSQGDSAITGADGTFSLSGLSVPYDINVWSAADEWAHIYKGLTASEVSLTPALGAPPVGTVRNATVSGTLSGGTIPVAADQVVMVCVAGVDGFATGCDTVLPTESTYSVNVTWLDDASRDVRVHALQVQRDGSDKPVSYPGYTSTALTVTNAVPSVVDLDLGSALPTSTVTVTVDGAVAPAVHLAAVQVAPNLALLAGVINSAMLTQEFVMPVIDGASYTFLSAVNLTQFGWHADITGTEAHVTVPGVTQLVAPADTATGVTTATNFAVTNPAGGPVTYLFMPDTSGPTIGVTSMDTTITIPDLATPGLALPAGAAYSWMVFGHSGDSAEAGTRGIEDYYAMALLLGGTSTGFTGSGTFSLSDSWDFTTAP